MVAIEPKFSTGLGTGTQGYILAVGGTPLNGPGFWTAYYIQSKQWKTIPATAAAISFTPYVELEGHTATVDPSTGLVYIIGGFDGMANNALLPEVVNLLTVFDPRTATILSQEKATTDTSLTGANAVWSTKRGTVLVLGGSRAVATVSVTGLDMTVLTEYNPTTKQWTSMTTSGAIPPARLDACAAITDDGSKVIVYGGATDANTYLSSIYILDLTSGVWTAGPPTAGVLSQATCAFNAGQFIVFAGSINPKDMNSLTGATPLVFDVGKGAWATSYTASSGGNGGGNSGGDSGGNGGSGSLRTPTHPSGSGGDDQNGDNPAGGKSHTAAIIGAIAGVLLLLLIGLAVYLVRRRRRRNMKRVQDAEERAAALLAAEGKYDSEKKKIEPKVMTAADHYAAAQAALEEASKRLRPSAFKGTKSWISEANTNSVSDGNSTAISKARRLSLSDPEVKADPALYYQQLVLKQHQLQMQHPHLIGGLALRSPHSCAHLGGSEDGNDSDGSSNSGSSRSSDNSLHERRRKRRHRERSTNDSKNQELAIQTMHVWVPPQGIQELIVSPSPSSPQDWGNNSSIIFDNNGNGSNSIVNTHPPQNSLTRRISSWDLEPSPMAVRSPHAIVGDLKAEHISSTTTLLAPTTPPSFAFSSEPSSSSSSVPSHNNSSSHKPVSTSSSLPSPLPLSS
ncbi:hypothetical protein BGW39_001322 [Mortierella sp. 14UC]|nr:hypothetical protein BGW39_001322 [Mortierella sp. 14UC]